MPEGREGHHRRRRGPRGHARGGGGGGRARHAGVSEEEVAERPHQRRRRRLPHARTGALEEAATAVLLGMKGGMHARSGGRDTEGAVARKGEERKPVRGLACY